VSADRRFTARERIIVALDVPDRGALADLLDRLEGQPRFYKVGLELFVAEGGRAVELVKARGGRVFLDLKLHDIPETVARAVKTAGTLGVDLLTVHISGGREMLQRAVAAASGGLQLLGVTVLTSLTAQDLDADGTADTPAQLVARRARLAAEAGLSGLVCSSQEIALARAAAPQALLVVPGIRPAGAGVGLDDQKRIATPAAAIAAGADCLVVGRPIRDAASPAEAFVRIVQEVESAA
jgi:orotidine-5'-phosphate decarboxylase